MGLLFDGAEFDSTWAGAGGRTGNPLHRMTDCADADAAAPALCWM
jgi:hypothetical protein